MTNAYTNESFRTREPFDLNYEVGPQSITVTDYEKTMNTLLEKLNKLIIDLDVTPWVPAHHRYTLRQLEQSLFKVKGFMAFRSTYYHPSIKMYEELKEAIGVAKGIERDLKNTGVLTNEVTG